MVGVEVFQRHAMGDQMALKTVEHRAMLDDRLLSKTALICACGFASLPVCIREGRILEPQIIHSELDHWVSCL